MIKRGLSIVRRSLSRMTGADCRPASDLRQPKDIPMFIGAACDSAFVDLTCAMLSSLDDNGGVADATIIFTGFGLTAIDKAKLRLAAGTLGRAMRFIDVSAESALIPALPSFSFPLPLLGCLIAPAGVDEPNARILLLDSDMIINKSLRPLFERDLEGHSLAAVKDMLVLSELKVRGREYDPNYFNAGLFLVDVDRWHANDYGNRAMRWLADQSQRPEWLDQDALNHVVGADWLRLERNWNLAYCGEDRLFTYEEYEAAHICHFSGAKPTEHRNHPGVPLYDHHAHRAEEKIGWTRQEAAPIDAVFVALAYDVLLGRELEDLGIARGRQGQSMVEAVTGFIGSAEYKDLRAMLQTSTEQLPANRWTGLPTAAHRLWAADQLPLLPETIVQVEQAESWDDLVRAIADDERLEALSTDHLGA